ncbi:MAG: U32 family peptidase [Deltaproteobacteria bacterium]|nr:U32 family peptidase [Deltaproteobacteria bacterium]
MTGQMDVFCPLRACAEIEPLARAGARHFYAGVDAVVLGVRAATSPILNCRPWPGCNFEDEGSVRAACEIVGGLGGRLHLTFNWFDYRPWEVEAILAFLDRSPTLDGVVLADLTLIARIRREHPRLRIVLSTVAHAQNGRSVGFFRRLGVDQVVLPRHLTIDEIEGIVAANPEVEFEAFVKNQDCHFSQGLCSYTHDVVDPALPYQCGSVRGYLPSRPLSAAEQRALETLGVVVMRSCGVCAIADLHRAGVRMVKLVGRELPLEQKIRDLGFIRSAIDAIGSAVGPYPELVRRLHERTYSAGCHRDCMY